MAIATTVHVPMARRGRSGDGDAIGWLVLVLLVGVGIRVAVELKGKVRRQGRSDMRDPARLQ